MGGRSSSGHARSGSGKAKSKDVCDISREVALQATNPAVISKLKKGDELLVRVLNAGSQASVVCENAEGRRAGSVVYAGVKTLIDCIEQGNNYIATVLTVDGGYCQVRIRRS